MNQSTIRSEKEGVTQKKIRKGEGVTQKRQEIIQFRETLGLYSRQEHQYYKERSVGCVMQMQCKLYMINNNKILLKKKQ